MAWDTENNASSAAAALAAEPILVDVRSTAEFMNGHLAGAHSLPLPHLEQDVIHKIPDRAAPVLLYCSTGSRSEQALGLMQQLGYSNVQNGGAATHLSQALNKPIKPGL